MTKMNVKDKKNDSNFELFTESYKQRRDKDWHEFLKRKYNSKGATDEQFIIKSSAEFISYKMFA